MAKALENKHGESVKVPRRRVIITRFNATQTKVLDRIVEKELTTVQRRVA